jgi:hypothetical protein
MKKLLAILALAFLAVSGTGYAVTCAYDNVPAATLLVPYWKVSLNGITSGSQIPGIPATGGTDTLVGIVNVSSPGVIAHVTVWNKYSRAVLDFNVPLTGKDVAYFRMSSILNGNLNVNALTQVIPSKDPCGINLLASPPSYVPSIGWGSSQYIRFSNPDASLAASFQGDAYASISQYATPAFPGFQPKVWDSLDESGDITTFSDYTKGNIIDADNPACGKFTTGFSGSDGNYSGNFSGYLTIDVVNFCTNFFPSDTQFYTYDAIATVGWGTTYTPNVLMGDVFYIDNGANSGNISGDPAVAIEFDSRLGVNTGVKTFYGKYVSSIASADCGGALTENNGTPCAAFNTFAPSFQFAGDGREPLGDRYGFRYYANQASQLQSWILVWRSDKYGTYNSTGNTASSYNDLCTWLNEVGTAGETVDGFYDANHKITAAVYDDDERSFQQTGSGGPSGSQPGAIVPPYIFLETQRINLLAADTWNPGNYVSGWADFTFRNSAADPTSTGIVDSLLNNQAWVGVQHTSPGAFVSVGYAAANLNNQFNCIPVGQLFPPGNNN